MVYSVTIKGPSDGLGERLARLPWVTHTAVSQHNGNSVWQVSVSDETAAEENLLYHILEGRKLTVIEFSRKKYELEEVFMQIVKGEGNGR